jgi:5-methylcytosine-specific restriction endonuclease McrA
VIVDLGDFNRPKYKRMPYKNYEDRKRRTREYYAENRETISTKRKTKRLVDGSVLERERSRYDELKNSESCHHWYSKNKEKRREYMQAYRSKKLVELRERERLYGLTPKGKEVRRVASQTHRAKYADVEGSYTTQEWIELKTKYDNRCLCCGRHESELDDPLQQDHVIPISKGGTNWITNIQPLCEKCNGMSGKGTKTIDYRSEMKLYGKP